MKRYQPLGLNAYFTLVSLSNAQYGDWIFWSKGSHDCPDSHVAMFIRMDGVNRVMAFGQNQFGKAYANEGSISTHGIIGVLRFKAWSIQSARKTNEELAQEVIEGLWGNGSERKSRLISAGYDYEGIQKLVNQKLNQNSTQKTVEQLAEEVIAGQWGNGQERIQRLKAAGYQPSVVQTKVNQKLS